MEAMIELTIKLPVTFDIKKGQNSTFDNPGCPDSITDIDYTSEAIFKAVADGIESDLKNIKAEIYRQALIQREEAQNDHEVKDLD